MKRLITLILSLISLQLLSAQIATFDLPTGTNGVTPDSEIYASTVNTLAVEVSELSYTSNLLIDYNYANGYFRPYGWSDGILDDTKYLEFTITPTPDKSVTVSSIDINQKSNNATLGPQKVAIKVSTDNGLSFGLLTEVAIARTSFNNDTYAFTDLTSTNPLIFRLYAYESLQGTAAQKDFWIIDNISIQGNVADALPLNGASLGLYDFPTGESGTSTQEEILAASQTDDNLTFSQFNYTDNLTFDYQYGYGFFRPYAWTAGILDEAKYLEFKVVADEGKRVTVSEVLIQQKANTSSLGPQKVGIRASVDGATFSNVIEHTTESSIFGTNIYSFESLTGLDSVVFRIYGYESLLGTEAQKDYLILNNIEVFGEVSNDLPTQQTSVETNLPLCYYANSSIVLKNIDEGSQVRVYDMGGKLLLSYISGNQSSTSFNFSRSALLIIKVNNSVFKLKIK